MIDPTTQEVRTAVDQILQIVKVCIGIPVIETYKTKINPLLYHSAIRTMLEQANPKYNTTALVDDAALLEHLDVPQWLTLILMRWDLFEETLNSTSRKDVEDIKHLRNDWAHLRVVPLREIHKAEKILSGLLQSFGFAEQAKKITDIRVQLDVQMQKPQASMPTNEWIMDSESNRIINVIEPVYKDIDDGSTARMVLPTIDSELHVVIVDKERDTHYDIIPIREDRVVIGRSKSHATISKITVDDPRVSRVHLLISKMSTPELMITDLMSANGTTLDGNKLPANKPTPWKVGQMVSVGNTWLILRQGVA